MHNITNFFLKGKKETSLVSLLSGTIFIHQLFLTNIFVGIVPCRKACKDSHVFTDHFHAYCLLVHLARKKYEEQGLSGLCSSFKNESPQHPPLLSKMFFKYTKKEEGTLRYKGGETELFNIV